MIVFVNKQQNLEFVLKESELGCRFSVLLSLPYFDPIRNTVIDLMHNLYLGKDQLTVIEDRCRLFTLPNSVGRLPTNISSNYGGFKASQWRSWITVYSPIVLKGLLPDELLRCWLLYVRACCILGKHILTASDINTADLLLLAFCKKFEQLYGKEHCTPNMHLHLHIKNCLLDYGPAHSFWCFSFERYNGLLGSYHTNQKNIEIQIMRKFINSQILLSTKTFFKPEFLNTLQPAAGRISSTMSSQSYTDIDCVKLLNKSTSYLPGISFKADHTSLLLPPYRHRVFSADFVNLLEQLYQQLYPEYVIMCISPFYTLSGRALLCGEQIGSVMNATSNRSASIIMAFWPDRYGVIRNINYSSPHVGSVQYFCKHQITISTDHGPEQLQNTLAYVWWKSRHSHSDFYGSSATVCMNSDEGPSMFSFIPVQRISAIGAHCLLQVYLSGFQDTAFISAPVYTNVAFTLSKS